MTRREIIDWRQRTIEAEERHAEETRKGSLYPSGFTQEDKNDAAGWQGCAVGEVAMKSKKVRLIVGMELYDDGYLSGPDDRVLSRLGGEFSHVVEKNDFLRAYEIIDLIEARVLTLRYRAA